MKLLETLKTYYVAMSSEQACEAYMLKFKGKRSVSDAFIDFRSKIKSDLILWVVVFGLSLFFGAQITSGLAFLSIIFHMRGMMLSKAVEKKMMQVKVKSNS